MEAASERTSEQSGRPQTTCLNRPTPSTAQHPHAVRDAPPLAADVNAAMRRVTSSSCKHVSVPMARASAHSWRLPQGIQSAELPESPSHVPSALPCVQSPGGMAWACFSQRASCQQLRVDCAHHPNRWTRRPRPRHTPRCRRHRPPPAQRLRPHCHPHDLHWWRWQAVPGT